MAQSAEEIEKARQRACAYLLNQGKKKWFPYKEGGEASLEATAWSALALATDAPEAASEAAFYIVDSQNDDGGWSTTSGAGKSDWSSGLALLSLRLLQNKSGTKTDKLEQSVKKGLAYLLESRTEFYKPVARLLLLISQGPKALDYARGWPWDPDCFHWIEPTSYCLMALKLPAIPNAELYRKVIDHANDFITEHACEGGGWNHGNNITLGSQLPPYRLTTAEALLALQDIADDKAVQEALKYLRSQSDQDSSSLSLAYSILALRSYNMPAQQETELLLRRQAENGSFGINDNRVLATALAVLALSEKNSLQYSRSQAAQS